MMGGLRVRYVRIWQLCIFRTTGGGVDKLVGEQNGCRRIMYLSLTSAWWGPVSGTTVELLVQIGKSAQRISDSQNKQRVIGQLAS